MVETPRRNWFFWLVLTFVLSALILLMRGIVVSSHAAEWQPTGYASWKDGTKHKAIKGGLYNFPDVDTNGDTSWAAINTGWETVGDSMAISHRGILKTTVWKDGRTRIDVTFKGYDIQVERRLLGFWHLDTRNWESRKLYDADFDQVSSYGVSGRDCYFNWGSPVWCQFRIRRGPAQTAHQIEMRSAMLNAISDYYESLNATQQRYAVLANVYKISLNIPDSLILPDSLCRSKVLKRFAHHRYWMRDQVLHFPGHDTLWRWQVDSLQIDDDYWVIDSSKVKQRVPINQRWYRRNGDMFFVEYVSMRSLDSIHALYPDSMVWHAGSDEIEDADIEDSWMNGGVVYQCINYGASEYLRIKNGLGADQKRVWVAAKDVHDISLPEGDSIDACSLRIAAGAVTSTATVDVYRCFKPVVEGTQDASDADSGLTWPHACGYKDARTCAGYQNWSSDGAGCAYDDGVDNSSGTGCYDSGDADRTETAMSSVSVSTTIYYKFHIDPALANCWYDGDCEEYGLILQTETSGGEVEFNSTETS